MAGGSAAAVAATACPGVDTLTFLTAADVSALAPADLVDAVIASERLLAHVNAVQAELLAELGRPGRCGDITAMVDALIGKAGQGRNTDGHIDQAKVDEVTRETAVRVAATEIAAVLDWSPITAKIRIGQAQRMLTALPGTHAALRAGRVDVGRARMITDRTAVLGVADCGRVEARILPLVTGRSKARLEALVDREVITADPAAAEHRRIKANTDREVVHRPDKDGMGIITALLPADAAVILFTLIDLIAQANKGLDGRTVDQRRADALTDIADELLTHGYVDLDRLIALTHHTTNQGDNAGPAGADGSGRPDNTGPADTTPATPDPATTNTDTPSPADAGTHTADTDTPNPAGTDVDADAVGGAVTVRSSRVLTRHGRRPHLTVTGAATTLAGLDDLPGHLDGHGAITAPLLRAIAASYATLTAITLNPATGTATAIGALTYRPRQQLADQAITLAGTCRTPGCRQPAWRCHLDHLQPFNHHHPTAGGPTTLGNLHPQCGFHHLLKHHSDWTPRLQPDLSITWTTNTGHTATSHPREFTTPGATEPTRETGEETARGQAHDQPHPENAASATPTERIITGPTVAGPTIPVLPAGADHHEPHTELEDPDTIPDPGSITIHPYRIQRQHLREHTLRRIGKITKLFDPTPHTPDAPRGVPADLQTHSAPDGQALSDLRITVEANLHAIRLARHPIAAPIGQHPDTPPHTNRDPTSFLDTIERQPPPPEEPPF